MFPPTEDLVAVYVAQVPDLYHFPLDIRHPPLFTLRYPLPSKGPVAVGAGGLFRVVVGRGEEDFGRYLTEPPQVPVLPTIAAC